MLKNLDCICLRIEAKTMLSWSPMTKQPNKLLLGTEFSQTFINTAEHIHSFSHPRLVRWTPDVHERSISISPKGMIFYTKLHLARLL